MHLPVDGRDQLVPRAALALEVEVSHPDARPPRLSSVTLEVSTDDGRTWRTVKLSRPRPGVGRYRAGLPAGTLPPGGALSLRISAADTAGNHTEQTIIRAGLVAPS